MTPQLIKKKNEAIKDRVIRDIRNLFEHEEEQNYYKVARVGNFWRNIYIEYESNGDRNNVPSVEIYLSKVRPYLKNIISNRKKSYMCKIQSTIATNLTTMMESL